MAQPETVLPSEASVADVAARLALWARRAAKGLARVEFISDFSRRDTVTALRAALPASLPVHEIKLPFQKPPLEVVHFLRERLRELPPGIVSVTGFAAAFSADCPLEDALRVLNFHREELAQFPLRQIWWMPPPFVDAFLRFIPDLDSWFLVRLTLSEVIVDKFVEQSPVTERGFILSPEEAHKHSAAYVARFENAITNPRTAYTSIHLALVAVIFLGNAHLKQEEQELAVRLLNQMTPILHLQELIEKYSTSPKPDALFVPEPLNFSFSEYFRGLGELYERSGKNDEAEAFYKASLAIELNSVYYFSDTDRSCRSIIGFYVHMSRYFEAEKVCNKWIAIQENEWGQNSDLILPALDELLAIYFGAEKYKEAEQTFYRMLFITKASMAQSSFEKLLKANMAWFYRRLGRYAEAEVIAQQAAQELDGK